MKPSPSKNTNPPSTERLKSEMAAESQAEFYISPGVSEQAAIRAALQNQEAYRADEAPRVTSPQAARRAKSNNHRAA